MAGEIENKSSLIKSPGVQPKVDSICRIKIQEINKEQSNDKNTEIQNHDQIPPDLEN